MSTPTIPRLDPEPKIPEPRKPSEHHPRPKPPRQRVVLAEPGDATPAEQRAARKAREQLLEHDRRLREQGRR